MIYLVSVLPIGFIKAEPNKPILSTSAEAICTGNPYFAFISSYTDDGTYGSTVYRKYQYSENGQTWVGLNPVTKDNSNGFYYVQRPVNLKAGWYRVLVADWDRLADDDQCVISDPIYIEKWEDCSPNLEPFEQEQIEGVCTQGTLLFREDFGGNDPSDPAYGPRLAAMDNIGYSYCTSDYQALSPGYRVVKYGHENRYNSSTTANLSSQWHIQDDHTYYNDYTRGYFLEVDGGGGDIAFYSTTINVCPETELSFSAYVANVMASHQYSSSRQPKKPKVLFRIEDADQDTVIASASSKEIPSDERYNTWRQEMITSAAWHLVGMTFSVPQGVENVRLSIYNDLSGNVYDGNDFALDDIEIRLCTPLVTIESTNEACHDSVYRFEPVVTQDSKFQEPFEYLWEFSADSLTWIPKADSLPLTLSAAQYAETGWYRLGVAGAGNIDNPYCRALSNPFRLDVIDCTPPILPKLGVISPDEVCLDSAYCWKIDTLNKATFTEMDYDYAFEYSTDEITWTVLSTDLPDCWTAVDASNAGFYRIRIHYQDKWHDITHYSDTLHLQTIDCAPPMMPTLRIETPDWICRDSAYCFPIDTINKSDFTPTGYTYYWETSLDGQDNWTKRADGKELCIEKLQMTDSCWYRVAVNYTDVRWNITDYSIPVLLNVVDCTPATPPEIVIVSPGLVCLDSMYCFEFDTLNKDVIDVLPYTYHWEYSKDNSTWEERAVGDAYCLNAVTPEDSGYYRVRITYESQYWSLDMASASFFLHTEDCAPPVLPELQIVASKWECLDSAFCFAVDTLNKSSFTPVDYSCYWETSPDGQDNWTKRADGKELCIEKLQMTDSCWYRVAVNYTDIRYNLTAYSDTKLFGVRDCYMPPPLPKPVIVSGHTVCRDSAYCFEVDITNAEAIPDTAVYAYRWEYSRNSRLWGSYHEGLDFCLAAAAPSDSGWYRLRVSYVHPALEDVFYTRTFMLAVESCAAPDEPESPDNPENPETPDNPDHPDDPEDPDTPETPDEPEDPDTPEIPDEPDEPDEPDYPDEPDEPDEPEEPDDPEDPTDPVVPEPPVEQLYELIFNKYNWVIVCDNTRVAEWFDNPQKITYQWYKDGVLVEGATEDDYSERKELRGVFQLYLTIGDKQIKSNLLSLPVPLDEAPPQQVAVYNHLGILMFETEGLPITEGLPSGIYIFVYQIDNQVCTTKVIVP